MISPEKAETRCVTFIRKYVNLAKASGVVVGVSGGVDSATVLHLSSKALGPRNVKAAVLPSDSTPQEDTKDAIDMCTALRVPFRIYDISPVLHSFYFPDHGGVSNLIAYGNLKARIRMAILYWFANTENRLVAGTGDRSETLLGFYTKYGDGGVDFSPIGDLYKTEVRELARHLGVPEAICRKPSSPQLWTGHSAEEELGADYDAIDPILEAFSERRVVEDTPFARSVRHRMERNLHKHLMPPVCRFR